MWAMGAHSSAKRISGMSLWAVLVWHSGNAGERGIRHVGTSGTRLGPDLSLRS